MQGWGGARPPPGSKAICLCPRPLSFPLFSISIPPVPVLINIHVDALVMWDGGGGGSERG